MVFSEILGYRAFVTEDEIRSIVAKSRFTSPGETFDSAKTLLIFSTSNQQTWCVKTSHALYVVLDDRRKESPRVQWSMPLEEAQRATVVSHDYKPLTGMIDIGPRKEWRYTKRLFQEENIESVIKRFISDML